MGIPKIFRKLKKKYNPTEQEIAYDQWMKDGGNYNLRFNYNFDNTSFVMDLGGYDGQWASDIYSRCNCKIAIFEPVEYFYNLIKERFKLNPNIEPYCYGLGNSSRDESIQIDGDASSIYNITKDNNSQRIKIIDIDQWLSEKKVKSIQLMKINIEGGEYELLERLIELDKIRLIDCLQIQFHKIENNSKRRMEKIHKELEKTHFTKYKYTFIWDDWRKK